MTPPVRGLLLTFALALIAGFAGVGIGKFVFQPPHNAPTLHEVIHNRLNLTPAQLQRIEGIESDYRTRRKAYEKEMRAANAELAAAIRDEHGYGPKVTSAVGRFHNAMGGLQTAMLQHVFAMRAELTPAQKEIFDNTVMSALTAEEP
ncbi:MAG TPA: periplasmic heavy metal sensor [Caulobacterales bacterium]|nr:periplasmic heavy metal sensor [Caulobacterales bacterium]